MSIGWPPSWLVVLTAIYNTTSMANPRASVDTNSRHQTSKADSDANDNITSEKTYLKFGISERFLSSKVELRRLDCIGSWGERTKYQQIFLRTYIDKNIRGSSTILPEGFNVKELYRNPLLWVFFHRWNVVNWLVAATNFKVIIAMCIISTKMIKHQCQESVFFHN